MGFSTVVSFVSRQPGSDFAWHMVLRTSSPTGHCCSPQLPTAL